MQGRKLVPSVAAAFAVVAVTYIAARAADPIKSAPAGNDSPTARGYILVAEGRTPAAYLNLSQMMVVRYRAGDTAEVFDTSGRKAPMEFKGPAVGEAVARAVRREPAGWLVQDEADGGLLAINMTHVLAIDVDRKAAAGTGYAVIPLITSTLPEPVPVPDLKPETLQKAAGDPQS